MNPLQTPSVFSWNSEDFSASCSKERQYFHPNPKLTCIWTQPAPLLFVIIMRALTHWICYWSLIAYVDSQCKYSWSYNNGVATAGDQSCSCTCYKVFWRHLIQKFCTYRHRKTQKEISLYAHSGCLEAFSLFAAKFDLMEQKLTFLVAQIKRPFLLLPALAANC